MHFLIDCLSFTIGDKFVNIVETNMSDFIIPKTTNNNIINDPYWENNELEQRWIENENWVYEKAFKLLDTLLEMQRIELHFEGLDTYSKV